MADVRPEIEVEALGDDFAAAKPDDLRLRLSLTLGVDHLFRISKAKARHLIPCAIMA
jgi:hypothetical protein